MAQQAAAHAREQILKLGPLRHLAAGQLSDVASVIEMASVTFAFLLLVQALP